MKFKLILFCLFNLLGAAVFAQEKKAIDYVDVFMGTSNSRWMLGPYATMPYGMVQLGPDNQGANQGYNWMAGYEYAINSVDGFSHIHAWTMAGLRLMPTTADLSYSDEPTDSPYKGAGAGYHSRIQKETEKASPGYYAVYLYDHDVKAEMAVTTRCGLQRYTFPEKKESRILIDLQFPTEYDFNVKDAKITKVTDTEIEGYAESGSGGFNDYKLCFVLQFDKPFQSFNAWVGKKLTRNCKEISGKGDVGAFVTYKTQKVDQVHVRSGISLVSIEQARLNLKTEMEPFGWNIEAVKQNAEATWNTLLSTIKVEGGTETDKAKFYTNLYRVFAAKQTWNDVNGKYVDPAEKVQTLKYCKNIYGGDAFWNTFWNTNGVLSLIAPDMMENWVGTQLELHEHTGWTGKGPTGLEYSGIMEGSHEIALMVAAYQKGIVKDKVIAEKIYEAAKFMMMNEGVAIYGGEAGNPKLKEYMKFGYVPYEIGKTNKALDYAFDDYCVAQMAKSLGKKADYDYFIKRSQNYRNVFNTDLKFVVPKDSKAKWIPNYDEFSNNSFVEGNGWEYSFYVPHDVDGLINLMGKDLFNKRLNDGFEKSQEYKFAAHALDRTTGERNEFYINQGNEINMQPAFLFNYSAKPWLTQKWTRNIMETFYGATPYQAWEGDEDEGQMGGWFVMSSMGLFEMRGGTETNPELDLTSPLFNKITIQLDPKFYKGKEFVIEAHNNSKENIYIQSATLNGKTLTRTKIHFKDIVNGGKLYFEMGPLPNKNWGVGK
ncbi:glycoside hydrolase family 92 protein [Pedobacter sp. KBW01]|uniref:GH92 family glycosyl hydrolase n=1 Tax=Pedobacter sp. KBW01 TaxID=2153364 RepID=UPI000F5A9D0C|nr:GH92 family glycosyl hydrolase [Pedobacter sp. KBW01]RQO64747.1 glycoside hydrolase family 92 protein [Pedobacter sp. KBW01]